MLKFGFGLTLQDPRVCSLANAGGLLMIVMGFLVPLSTERFSLSSLLDSCRYFYTTSSIVHCSD
jgi:hypothetical protein